MTQRFTVFARKEGDSLLYFATNNGDTRPQTVAGLIEFVVGKSAIPVAWAAEWPIADGGERDKEILRAESIAAGRVIELVDGRYVARGVPPSPIQYLEDDSGVVCGEPGATHDHREVCSDGYNYALGMPCYCAKSASDVGKRPRLTWADPKPFDPHRGFFEEWRVLSVQRADDTSGDNSHPLQLSPDAPQDFTPFLHGSAHLMKG